MRTQAAVVALCLVLVMGCGNKEEELKGQLSQTEKDRESLKSLITERDAYVEEVMHSVNDIYKDLESTRAKEGRLLKRTEGTEGPQQVVSVDTRQQLLADINDIGSVLKENRKRISNLQVRARKFQGQIASLDTLITNLKTTLLEREQSIALLETKVQGLEATVAQKIQMISEKETVIDNQVRKMNTAYYVVGTRSELKEKGIITDEGGFLWGLLGSTTIMSSGIDQAQFTPIDVSKEQTIHVQGKIDELLPHRKIDSFTTDQLDEKYSDLKISSPNGFWQDRYLVIVLD